MALLLSLVLAQAGALPPQVKAVPQQAADGTAARAGVEVYLVNEGAAPATATPPDAIETMLADGSRVTLHPTDRTPRAIAPGTFAKLTYRADPVAVAGTAPPARGEAGTITTPLPSHDDRGGGDFLDRFSAYRPTYAAAGTDGSAIKLQLSFAFRPFEGDGLLSRVRFAWTQTMFWAVDRPSGPFRATTYSPELFLTQPLDDRLDLQVGYAHDSNGRGTLGSVDVNRLFVRARQTVELGGGWQAEVVPQAWVFVGNRAGAQDIERYWGYTGLSVAAWQAGGLKLGIDARGNPGTGRGAAEAFLSYPLAAPLGFGVYGFVQGFTGNGEALDDFRRRETRLRVGIALTR